ncbi:MAG TPA: hypothetical protein VHC22_34075 [Pirellulales bacterium]|nr:hypothetical protein [Pirellulales bacterium]
MSKQTMPTPTFSVRFVAEGISPQQVPLRAVNDALSAVQDIASGRDPFVTAKVDPGKAINLVRVRGGSAIYSCISHSPEEAMANLTRAGSLIASAAGQVEEDGSLVSVLKPLERLSEVARTVHCRLEVVSDPDGPPLLVVEGNDYERVSKKLLVRGDATVIGSIKRVGGKTEMRCALQVPGRTHLLYCGVANRDLVQRLGQHLYERIAAVGPAVWIHRTWYVYDFKIVDFSQPKMGAANEAIERLRKAGLSGWDDVPNPEKVIRGMR